MGSVEQRVSGLGPPLDPATLHGGWQLMRAAWDRAARHPNATVLSPHAPRVLLVRGFLSPSEVEHLVTLAAGAAGRWGRGGCSGSCLAGALGKLRAESSALLWVAYYNAWRRL